MLILQISLLFENIYEFQPKTKTKILKQNFSKHDS